MKEINGMTMEKMEPTYNSQLIGDIIVLTLIEKKKSSDDRDFLQLSETIDGNRWKLILDYDFEYLSTPPRVVHYGRD